MGRLKEPLNRGLVDGPDPATLEPGELSDLQNAVYKPNSQALQRAMGRATFGTATATAFDVSGLRDAQFDNGDHYLIAQVSAATGSYLTAYVGDTGTFGAIATALTASTALEVAQFRNRYYLFNGTSAVSGTTGTNQVFYLSATAASSAPLLRQHGMVPVTSSPQTATSSATFALTVTGFYEYWTTEVARIIQDGASFELESTFSSASPVTVNVSSTAFSPVITMPVPVNPGIMTHWRVYRSVKKEHSQDKAFPSGFSIATLGTATAQMTDTLTQSSTSQILGATTGSAASPFGDWSNAARLTADDGSYASAQVQSSPVARSVTIYGYNFGGFSGNVRGIEVELKTYIAAGSSPRSLAVTLGRRAPDGTFQPLDSIGGQVTKSALVTATSPSQTITLGSSTDRWVQPGLPGFADTDFDASFMVRLIALGQVFTSTTFGVDYVKVKVYYGVGLDDSVRVFPSVVYTFGDISAQVGKNGQPPCSSTGDLFEDTLVVNDVTNPGLIRWSFPGEPESFPETYFIDFETRDNDRVTLVKVVNNRLVVGLENAMYRVNYLPSERDSSFDRGKAIDPVTTKFGCVNAMCACVFSMDSGEIGTSQWLAWVSYKGIHMTDGFTFKTLTNDLDWSKVRGSAGTTYIALINDPENQDLVFYYSNADLAAGSRDRSLHLSYAVQHIIDSARLKVSGKVMMKNYSAGNRATLKSAWSVPRGDAARLGQTSIYLGYGSATAAGGGMVYRETGQTIPAEDNTYMFATRRMFLAGESSEFRLNEVYGYLGNYTGQPGIDMTAFSIKTNDDAGEVQKSTPAQKYSGRKLGKWQFRQMAEGLRLQPYVTGNPDNDLAWEYLILDGEGFGTEDSGK